MMGTLLDDAIRRVKVAHHKSKLKKAYLGLITLGSDLDCGFAMACELRPATYTKLRRKLAKHHAALIELGEDVPALPKWAVGQE